MKKKIIRLTESDLHKIIKESVKRVLKEIDDPKGQIMSSDWDLQDGGDLKHQQMTQDWERAEFEDRLDKQYMDDLADENYYNDYNHNIDDSWLEKEPLPF